MHDSGLDLNRISSRAFCEILDVAESFAAATSALALERQ
jgi:hypothetical protein